MENWLARLLRIFQPVPLDIDDQSEERKPKARRRQPRSNILRRNPNASKGPQKAFSIRLDQDLYDEITERGQAACRSRSHIIHLLLRTAIQLDTPLRTRQRAQWRRAYLRRKLKTTGKLSASERFELQALRAKIDWKHQR